MSPYLKQGRAPLFDKPLEVKSPLSELWETAEPIGELSSRAGMRYQKTGHLLVRAHIGVNNRTKTEQTIKRTERHLELLRTAGMHIVRHLSEVHPNIERVAGSDPKYMIITASKYVAKSKPLWTPEAKRSAPRQSINENVFRPLSTYLDWAYKENPKALLSEIYDPTQYSWQQDTDIVYLHDVDPVMTEYEPSHPDTLADYVVDSFKSMAPSVPLFF
jgi:hypothetical protein